MVTVAGLEGLDRPDIVAEFRSAMPWPHLVRDGAIEPGVAAAAAAEVSALPERAFTWQRTRRIQKGSLSDRDGMGPVAGSLVDELASPGTIELLRRFSGIADLVGDPALAFAGVYLTPPGGWQRVHQDFTRHPATRAHNRVALLLYLSEWTPGDGGELELWRSDMRGDPVLVEPRPGRLVVFAPDAATLHGISPVRADGPPRVAIGMRYYSAQAPMAAHRPIWRQTVRRPGESARDVVPSLAEIVRMGARLHSIRRTNRRVGSADGRPGHR